jgi:hypothetical protein
MRNKTVAPIPGMGDRRYAEVGKAVAKGREGELLRQAQQDVIAILPSRRTAHGTRAGIGLGAATEIIHKLGILLEEKKWPAQ